MGRGLSYLQERILVWVRDRGHPPEPWWSDHFGDFNHVAPWLDCLAEKGKVSIDQKLWPPGPRNPDLLRPPEERYWTPATIAAVSRALRRLEARGLIVRFPRLPDPRDILWIKSSNGQVTKRLVGRSGAAHVRRRTHWIALTDAGQAIAATLPD
jgi:hypothetical protein